MHQDFCLKSNAFRRSISWPSEQWCHPWWEHIKHDRNRHQSSFCSEENWILKKCTLLQTHKQRLYSGYHYTDDTCSTRSKCKRSFAQGSCITEKITTTLTSSASYLAYQRWQWRLRSHVLSICLSAQTHDCSTWLAQGWITAWLACSHHPVPPDSWVHLWRSAPKNQSAPSSVWICVGFNFFIDSFGWYFSKSRRFTEGA